MMQKKDFRIAVLVGIVCALQCNSGLGQLQAEPFSGARAHWTTSQVQGYPDPLPPYTVDKWQAKIDWERTMYAAAESGRDSLLVVQETCPVGLAANATLRIPNPTAPALLWAGVNNVFPAKLASTTRDYAFLAQFPI
jgi:hypothetical protein